MRGGARMGTSRKGIPNKIGRMAKENIVEVFNTLGGAQAMLNWARKNKTTFYKLYARLIPTEIVGTLDVRDARQLSDQELLAIASSGLDRAVIEAASEGEPEQVH